MKLFRDIIIILTCTYLSWHISTLHKSDKEIRIEAARKTIKPATWDPMR